MGQPGHRDFNQAASCVWWQMRWEGGEAGTVESWRSKCNWLWAYFLEAQAFSGQHLSVPRCLTQGLLLCHPSAAAGGADHDAGQQRRTGLAGCARGTAASPLSPRGGWHEKLCHVAVLRLSWVGQQSHTGQLHSGLGFTLHPRPGPAFKASWGWAPEVFACCHGICA